MKKDLDTETVVPPKGEDKKVGVWNGKVNFEDQVTRTLYAILKESRRINQLLSKLIGDNSPSEQNKSSLGEIIDTAKDLLDNGKRDYSNVKKPSKKSRK